MRRRLGHPQLPVAPTRLAPLWLAVSLVAALSSCKRSDRDRPAEPHDRPAGGRVAMLRAPEGATHCESAYNAYAAERDAARAAGVEPFYRLGDRDAFLAACGRLPPEAQLCLVPRLAVPRAKECEAIVRPLEPQLLPVLEPTRPKGLGEPPAPPPPATDVASPPPPR